MILLPKQPKILDRKDNFARFEIEGLYPGYGVVMGNSLRSVLISSLSGAAVTQVKIKGVQHEFMTLSGITEDVISLLMNLKQMRFIMHSDEPQKATLKIKGEKEVKGSDFKFPTQVELVNKSCHIATLTDKKADLEMEIQIEKGIGYEPIERRRKKEKLEIGVIPIDAIFTPIKRVSFKIENMRVGDRTDFDRLYLEVETDGTIAPEQAFFQSADTLVKHFSLLAEAFTPEVKEAASVSEEVSEDKKKTKIVKKGKKKTSKK
jgi:DNA-directed RNA polymerase subunit alpha